MYENLHSKQKIAYLHSMGIELGSPGWVNFATHKIIIGYFLCTYCFQRSTLPKQIKSMHKPNSDMDFNKI